MKAAINGLTQALPFLIAKLDPKYPPTIVPKNSTPPILKSIIPAGIKISKAKLDEIILGMRDVPLACKIVNPYK